MADLTLVGGKNASLGEMYRSLVPKGVRVPNGFAITTASFWNFLDANHLRYDISNILDTLDRKTYSNLEEVGEKIRELIVQGKIPALTQTAIVECYSILGEGGKAPAVAVRSSATAEDLPNASFAGQQETYLNVTGIAAVLDATRKCFASLYTDRAIKYREDNGFDHMGVGLSVGVQLMVRSDKGSSGVAFTLDPDTGFRNVIVINGAWGLGENVVQGAVTPDEFVIFKPSLRSGKRSIISRKLGAKEKMMIYDESKLVTGGLHVQNIATPEELKSKFVLTDSQVELLAQWLDLIEVHYQKPMDCEWALDGITGELAIVQARPETVRSRETHLTVSEYELIDHGTILTEGIGLGNKIVTGRARMLTSHEQSNQLLDGEILVTDITSPDWDPILKRAGAIITNKGGRTSHAAIVARELGTPGIVGTVNATTAIKDGQTITIYCDGAGRGIVYDGALRFVERESEIGEIQMPKTKPMLILADPEQAFKLSFYPNAGIGLLRIEFIVNNWIKIHPMALVNFDNLEDAATKSKIAELTKGYPDKKEFFVEQLAEGVATIASAFYPKDVIVRMSDFKTNEYASLIGGIPFEPKEENPMIGFRGASRYYNPRYQPGFALECQAMLRVRRDMGLMNVKLMIPFCRTVEEGKRVLEVMRGEGLIQGDEGLEIYVMAEIPSNVVLADQFAEIFDGFSIGSNDLTQLTLGIDRDSSIIHDLFDENNDAPRAMIAYVIKAARLKGRKIGLCGQAPSDHPQFAEFLVSNHIDSISFNPDALLRGIENINLAEAKYPMHFDLASEEAIKAHADHHEEFDVDG
jgi:pyruvate,water dikinase